MGNQVWRDLHELDHVDSSGNSVSNEFVYPKTVDDIFGADANEYQQSIQNFIVGAAVGGCVGIVIIAIIAAVINCCYNDDKDSGSPGASSELKTATWAKYIRWFVSVLVLITIIISFVYVGMLNTSIEDVQTTMNESYEPYKAFIDNGNAINTTLNNAINETEVILTKTNNSIIASQITDFQNDLLEAQDKVSDYGNSADDIDWENAGDSLDTAREVIVGVGIGLACFTLILLALSLCSSAISTKMACCSAFISVLVVFAMLLVWIIASVQFGVSVEVADICANPDSAIIQGINLTSFDPFNNDTIPLLKYYIYCDSDHSYNPLVKDLNSAYDTLSQSNGSLSTLVTYSEGTNVEGNMVRLDTYYNEVLNGIVELNETLKCDDINGFYVDLKDLMCEDLLDSWYGFYVSQWVTVGFLLLGFCFTCKDSVHRRLSQFTV